MRIHPRWLDKQWWSHYDRRKGVTDADRLQWRREARAEMRRQGLA